LQKDYDTPINVVTLAPIINSYKTDRIAD